MRPLQPHPDKDPTLRFEQELFNEFRASAIIGVDEAGRGAVAGPVAVGVHVVFPETATIPQDLRDSKLLSEQRREHVFSRIDAWGPGAVGFGTATEIDKHGISVMLGQAARRALLELHGLGIDVAGAVILLDGTHDWLSPVLQRPLRVVTRAEADRRHASVSAAALRAKVLRDRLMIDSHDRYPVYEWQRNKGYGSAAHYGAIRTHGITPLHRVTWVRKLDASRPHGHSR